MQQRGEPLAVFGEIDRIRRGPQDRDTRLEQRQRQLQRCLPAELDDARDLAACAPLAVDDRHHVFERQRLEVQTIRRVVVGRYGLRVAIDHHRLVTLLAEAEHGVDAAVIELDSLTDAVRTAAEDDDLLVRRRLGLVLLFERAVQVRRERLELRGTGIDALVGRRQPVLQPSLADDVLADAVHRRDVRVAEPAALQRPQQILRHLTELAEGRHLAQRLDVGELLQEPGIDFGQLVECLDRPAAAQGAEKRPHPAIVRDHQPFPQDDSSSSSSPVSSGPLGNRLALLRDSSSDRTALRNASLNVRPIDIASPTDFICVVSVRSACGNFSKFQRGNLTTM